VTDADGAAQRIIYNEIYKVCKDIKITGEESDLEMDHCHSSDQHVDQTTIITSASCGLEDVNEFQWIQQEFHSHYDEKRIEGQIPESTSSSSVVDCSRVCVFVDPLDGTSSYAKGEYDAVTILIAIILDNVPIFGVIAKPFVNPNDDSHGVETENGCPPWRDTGCSIIYGGSLIQGVFNLGGGELQRSVEWKEKQKSQQQQQHYQQQQHQDETIQQTETDTHQRRKRRAIISKSKMGGCVGRCIESLSSKDLIHPEPSYISGAGMKTMKLVIGSNDESLWFFPKPGTSLWDVAAADALLRVMGGRISDGCGNDLDYSKGRLEGENMQGIIACIDSSLHAICLELYHDEKWQDVNE
jgi:3'-phosphoadenosine 5'-phosphosulfate (PAPS) 3'-phosphatase